jgi:hypothetical protein
MVRGEQCHALRFGGRNLVVSDKVGGVGLVTVLDHKD